MEVDDLNQSADAVDAHATEDDLLFAEDGVDDAEYTTGEVDQLLGDDEDAEKYYAEEGTDLEGVDAEAAHEEEGGDGEEHEGEGEEEGEGGEEGDSSFGYRGRGMRRPFFRGMRGGRFMMRGMMMMGPPRFFPPMHPGMRPPFPPFMGPGRPPFAMRGMRPMRLPMPIPPHFMRMPGVYHRYGGPTATRGRGGSNESRPAITSESGDTPPTTTKSDGPLPLMSIPTPAPLKAMVMAQRGRGMIGMGMGPRYHGMQTRGGATAPTSSYRGSSSASASHPRMPQKRPATSNGVQPMHVDHSEPQPKMSKPRNTLTYIRTVDEPMHSTPSTTTSSYYNRPQPHQQHQQQQHYPKPTHARGGYSHATTSSSHYSAPTASHYTSATSHYTPSATHYTTPTQYAPPATHYPAQSNNGYQPRPAYTPAAAAPTRFVVSHKPAPNLTQIPLTPSDSSQGPAANIRPVPAVRGVKVMVWNLPGSANFAEVSAMTTSCGSVRTLNVRKENNTAIIEFSNPQSADHFIRLHHNTIMDNCVLTVNRI
jgi:hypothetical protein